MEVVRIFVTMPNWRAASLWLGGVDGLIVGLIAGKEAQGPVGLLGIGVVLAAAGRLDVHGGDPDAFLTGKVVHLRSAETLRGVRVIAAQGPGIRDQQDQAGGIGAPVEGVDGRIDPGQRVLVEVMAGDGRLFHFGQAAFQSLAVLGRGKIADDLRGVAQLGGLFRTAAEGHHGKAHIVGHLVLFQTVIELADDVAALVDIGLHGDGRVHDQGDAGLGRPGHCAGLAAAGIDGGHLQQVHAFKGPVHAKNGHEVEALLGHGPFLLRRFRSQDGQAGRILAAGCGRHKAV